MSNFLSESWVWFVVLVLNGFACMWSGWRMGRRVARDQAYEAGRAYEQSQLEGAWLRLKEMKRHAHEAFYEHRS